MPDTTAKPETGAKVTPVGQPEPQKPKEPKHRNNVWLCEVVEVQKQHILSLQPVTNPPERTETVKLLFPVVGPAITTQAVKKLAKEKLGERMDGKTYRVAALSDDIEPIVKRQTRIDI